MRLTIPGLPPSTNHIYRHTGRVLKTDRAALYGWEVKEAVRQQGLLFQQFDGLLTMQVDLYVHNWRDLDADNIKACIDALADVYGFNDKHVIDLHVRKRLVVSRDDVRTVVTIAPYREEGE